MRDTLEARIEQTEKRYDMRYRPRKTRRRNLQSLGDGGDWRKVDEPGRVARRLIDLGMAEAVGEATTEATGDAPDPMVLERIIRGNQLIGADFFVRGAMAGRSVGRVVVRGPGGTIGGFGTGFLVTPSLLMTNNHVLDSSSAAQLSAVEFDFVEQQGRLRPIQEFRLRPDRFFATDDYLDFSLIAVDEVSTAGVKLEGRPWNPLRAFSGKAVVGERMNLIQHPAGRPQELSIRDNTVVDVFDDFLHYSSDTEQGSSGSPAFNDQWATVALHHSGVPKRNEAGQILLTSGEPWDGSGRTVPLIAWVANEGVRVSSIVAGLKERADGFTGEARHLLDELFEAEAPQLDPFEGPGTATPRAGTLPGPAGIQGHLDENGRVHWVLPLEITADLGGLRSMSVVDQPVTPAPPPVSSATPDPALSAVQADKLAEGLERLAAARCRPYLDVEQDTIDRDAFYANLGDGLCGRELFQRLSELVTTTHHTELSYKAARHDHLYPVVDLRPPPNLELASLYSGLGFDPEEIIRQELVAEARRDDLLRSFAASESSNDDASLLEFLDELESLAPFNCEHVVPQSWFKKRNPMKSDLHHLFTCEPGCNSFRSNIPYFQFGPEDEIIRNDCGRREETKFEPKAGRGAAARATLYFLLRYPGQVGDEGRELGPDRLDVLLRWHQEHRPDDWERHRNAEIFAVQGNRNPLIDHPDWAGQIDFRPGFGA